jgi:hypothetical protein
LCIAGGFVLLKRTLSPATDRGAASDLNAKKAAAFGYLRERLC